MSRILIVDDDPGLRYLLRLILTVQNHEVIEAASVSDAAMAIERLGVDLVVLDVQMPERDGLSLLAQLRQDPRWLTLPVILVTAQGSLDDVIHGLQAGADDYLAKPFHPSELLARITARLRARERSIA